ncbi:carbohydrate binding domain-containing protein [Paenibacillus sp. PAMC21692]|uniref:carbohydrate binding domain-containing protein n=1 Tax=Paenibacillus sp. PAMC21692 TaxID=2762320 RepID=UPI00164E4967|nr:carbohydrate binding domain-containing protein [Paenibacillus sp. PAMC21692]QNK57225.1 carbohydrate binding domain-containing protein [Paenibacillus sp. PAMC21692]
MRKQLGMLLAICLIVCLIPIKAGATDSSLDAFLVSDQSYNNGRGASDRPFSLGWGQYQVSEGYMNLYEATGNTDWLDKMVDQSGRIFALAQDQDHDGLLGWPNAAYAHSQIKNSNFNVVGGHASAENMLQNGSFEQDVNSDLVPDGWLQEGDPSRSYRSVVPDIAIDGTAVAAVETDGSSDNRIVQELGYTPGTTYAVEALAGLTDEQFQARIEAYNVTTGQVIAFERIHHIGMEQYVFEFKAPASGVIQIRLGFENKGAAGGKAYFDRVSVKASALPRQPLVANGEFETVDSYDATMPAHWSRWHTSTAANIYLTSSPSEAYEGEKALVVETDGSSWEVAEQDIAYEPGETYTVTWRGRIAGGTGTIYGRLAVYNATQNAIIASHVFNDTDWTYYSLTFTAPAASGETVRLRLYQSAYTLPGFKTYYDAIEMEASSEQLAGNGDFERIQALDATMPEGWTRWAQSNSSNVYLEDNPAHVYKGDYSLAITTDGSSWEIAEKSIDYEPNVQYEMSFYGKVSSAVAGGRARVVNMTTNELLGDITFTSTDWLSRKFTFIAPALPGQDVRIRLFQTNSSYTGFTSWFDHIAIRIAAPVEQLLKNQNMESVDPADVTLPANWKRGVGTTATNAYLTGAPLSMSTRHTGSRGAAVKGDHSADKMLVQNVAYFPSTLYELSVNNRVASTLGEGRISVYDLTDQVELASMPLRDISWTKRNLSFISPDEWGHELQVRLIVDDAQPADFIAYFDTLLLRLVAPSEAAGWERIDTPVERANRINGAIGGSAQAWIYALSDDGVSRASVSQTIYNYAPEESYAFLVTAKASPGATGVIRVVDDTSSTVLAETTFSNSNGYAMTPLVFETPSGGHVIRLELAPAAGSSLGDQIYISQVEGGQQWDQMVQEANIVNPMLRFADMVKRDPSLHADYLTYAEDYIAYVAEQIVHKWDPYWRQISGVDGQNNGVGIYIIPNGLSTEWFPGRTLAHNQYLAFARMLYLLYDATENMPLYAAERDFYLSRANDMSRAFKSMLEPHPLNTEQSTDAYLWRYWDNMGAWDNYHYYTNPGEDISHAALTLSGPLQAYLTGQVFSMEDMKKFARTFTDIMWNQSMTDPIISGYNFRLPTAPQDYTLTTHYHLWANYAQFDPAIADITRQVCEQNTCSVYLNSILAQWSRNKLLNTGFETIDTQHSDQAMFWEPYGMVTSGSVKRVQSDAASGKWSISITGDGSTAIGLQQQLADYEPNTPYQFSLKAKASAIEPVVVEVYDATAAVMLGAGTVSGVDWTSYSLLANMPAAAGHDIRIRVYTVGTANVDDVRGLPELYRSQLPNGGFETTDLWDDILPKYWKRGDDSSAETVYLENTAPDTGLQYLTLETAADGSPQQLNFVWNGYEPGASYTLTATGKTAGAPAGGKITITDMSNAAVLAELTFTSASWVTDLATFTTPAAFDHRLLVTVTHDDPTEPGGRFQADSLGIYLN